MERKPATVIKSMLNPAFYDHPSSAVELVETHISWVFLAGDFAYKLKKPVNFGFLDFSTLANRSYYCDEELRLNRRFAPQLYLKVVNIGGQAEAPCLGGEPVLDYAIKMRRFPSEQQLDRLQAKGQLLAAQMEGFAVRIAQIHRQSPVASMDQPFGTAELIEAPILQNFNQLRPLLSPDLQPRLDNLERWSRAACTQLKPDLQERKAQGSIRECHGDVHLGNMIWLDGEPVLFDCIEFDETLRWIDPINDIAFLVMDLDDRGEEELGWRFINRYLQESGDYPGLKLLNFYKVYRALVRAKVACLRLSQPGLSEAEQTQDMRLTRSYLDLATSYITPPQPRLVISHGLSGSGKSTFIKTLAPRWGAISIHSDIERKRLHGLATTAASNSEVTEGIYAETATTKTYQHLHDLAETLLRAGITVILDATFIKHQYRSAMQRLATRLQVPFQILDFPLATEELRRRIAQRTLQPGLTSEANREVLQYQLENEEPLSPLELTRTLRISPEMSVETLIDEKG